MKLSAICKFYSMSLSAMSLGDWFYVSRKGETGGGHPESKHNMAMSAWFGCEYPFVSIEAFFFTVGILILTEGMAFHLYE